MPALNPVLEAQLVAAFDSLNPDAAEIELTDYVTAVLNLNPSERATLLPDAATPADDERILRLDQLAAVLIAHRKHLFEKEARIPNGILYKRVDAALNRSAYIVVGLAHYLSMNGEAQPFIERVRQSTALRLYLNGIGDGLKLEALATCILRRICDTCYATRRTFDQGVDCVGSRQIIELDNWCCSADMLAKLSRIGERLHIIASCKANEGNVPGGIPATILPAHVRELIASWLIQRSDAGLWQRRAGIKLLSPLQLLLVTTYRLSDDSLSLCQKLGVAVWGIPELVHLLCRFAPDAVFPAASGFSFVASELDTWAATADAERIDANLADAVT